MEKRPCDALFTLVSLQKKTPSFFFRKVYHTSVYNPLFFEWDTNCEDCRPAVCGDNMNGYIYVDGKRISCARGGGFTHSSHWIEFASLSEPVGERTSEMAFVSARNNIVHELGHAFAKLMYYDTVGPLNNIPVGLRVEEGFYPSPISAMRTWRQHPGDLSSSEIFADMFLGWTYDKWGSNTAGIEKSDFMSLNMPFWISHLINNQSINLLLMEMTSHVPKTKKYKSFISDIVFSGVFSAE